MAATTTLAESGFPRLTLRRERLSLRRCKGCGREWPGHLARCRLCPAILGDPYEREIVLVTPQIARGRLRARALPTVVAALELSGSPQDERALREEAGETISAFLAALPDGTALRTLQNGVLVALVVAPSLAASAGSAARAIEATEGCGRIERRAGIAAGLIDGRDPRAASVVALAARLARAAQPGQALADYGAARLLDRDWQFGPVGVLPRRVEDAVERAAAFLGRKQPAPTPSAFAPDQGASLVGRGQELAALEQELVDAQTGEGRWCALVAPAGGGKSKLLRALLHRIDHDSVRVVGAAASAFGQAPRAVVDQLLTQLDTPVPEDATTERLVSALAAALAQSPPVLVLVDDLHWADADSLTILRLLSQQRIDRCLVVVALRSSFAPAVPWLFERARRIQLPPLSTGERTELLRRLLPGEATAPLRTELVAIEQSANPLYLEHTVALMREAGPEAPLPRSLHEAVLRRLEAVRARIDGRSYTRPSPEDLADIERTVGEWLDRLESEDHESRAQIADYLSLLEQIDAALVIAGSIAGQPQKRNRRLTAAIGRFYSAGFSERVDALERLADHDPVNAAAAAGRGGERALAALRFDDASAYFTLAARLTHGEERVRHLLALGDVLHARGYAGRARRAYLAAERASQKEATRARCQRRLGHAALAHEHATLAVRLLEQALPQLPDDERALASCDLALAHALAGDHCAATEALQELDHRARPTGNLFVRTRLRLALLGVTGDPNRLARGCISALTLTGEPLIDLPALIETTLLLCDAEPTLVGPELLDEAARAARRLALNQGHEPAVLASRARGRRSEESG
jgi:tetratricopeptide (TPR) repeat protein